MAILPPPPKRRIKRFRIKPFTFDVQLQPFNLLNIIRVVFIWLRYGVRFVKFYPTLSLEDAIDYKIKPYYIITIAKFRFKKWEESE